MTGPVTTEAMVEGLASEIADILLDGGALSPKDFAQRLVAGPALQRVTAERDEYAEYIIDLECHATRDIAELARLRAEGEAKDRRIAALEAALAPFAKAGGLFGPRQSNGWDVLIYSPAAGDEYSITADHLRAARAATAREG